MTDKKQDIVNTVKSLGSGTLLMIVLFFCAQSYYKQDKISDTQAAMNSSIDVLKSQMTTVVKVQDDQGKDIRRILFKGQLTTNATDSIANNFGTNFIAHPANLSSQNLSFK